jgi:hypothetical protein
MIKWNFAMWWNRWRGPVDLDLPIGLRNRHPPLLNKGQYYQLVQFVNRESIPNEIVEKLDLVEKYLGSEH